MKLRGAVIDTQKHTLTGSPELEQQTKRKSVSETTLPKGRVGRFFSSLPAKVRSAFPKTNGTRSVNAVQLGGWQSGLATAVAAVILAATPLAANANPNLGAAVHDADQPRVEMTAETTVGTNRFTFTTPGEYREIETPHEIERTNETIDDMLVNPDRRIFDGATEIDGKVTLEWTAPTGNTDGTNFHDENGDGIVDGVKGYILYRGDASRTYDDSRVIMNPSCVPAGIDLTKCTYEWTELTPGTHYFAIKAFKEVPGEARSESVFSNEAAKNVQ